MDLLLGGCSHCSEMYRPMSRTPGAPKPTKWSSATAFKYLDEHRASNDAEQ